MNEESKEFRLCPIFDNGLALLSDLNDYPFKADVYQCISDPVCGFRHTTNRLSQSPSVVGTMEPFPRDQTLIFPPDVKLLKEQLIFLKSKLLIMPL